MTTLEVNACVQAELDRVDGLLNQIYGILIKELSAGTDAPDPEPLLYSERLKTLAAAGCGKPSLLGFQNMSSRQDGIRLTLELAPTRGPHFPISNRS